MKNLLKNWKVHQSIYDDTILFISGDIYNDEKDRFDDGETIRTSALVETDFKNKTARTLNTLYNLE